MQKLGDLDLGSKECWQMVNSGGVHVKGSAEACCTGTQQGLVMLVLLWAPAVAIVDATQIIPVEA